MMLSLWQSWRSLVSAGKRWFSTEQEVLAALPEQG